MYSFVDIETTGSHSLHHHITEISIVNFDGNEITDRFTSLVRPDSFVPVFISHLTGITNEMVENAPLFEEIADRVESMTKDRIVVAHNAHFDYSFLKRAFQNNGQVFQRRTLCTLRLSRRILPGLRSYGLHNLCRALQISQRPEHRAEADAIAALQIFIYLQKTDREGVIDAALKKKTAEFNYPPHLPIEIMKRLPDAAGIYYFMDEQGKILYVGKAKSLKQRVHSHFVTNSSTRTRTRLMNRIHNVHYELCGNELVAMLMESAEIKKYFPPFNLAQKISDTNYGIYCYEDGNRYRRFGIKKLKASDQPLASFPFLADARIFLTEKMRAFRLCPKLCGLQRSLTACFDHEAGTCDGACCGKVEVAAYNRRVEDALITFTTEAKSYAVIGTGRSDGESSVVMIENGKYLGFGFAQKESIADNFSSLKETIQHSKDNREVQRIIQGYLGRNHDYRLIPCKV